MFDRKKGNSKLFKNFNNKPMWNSTTSSKFWKKIFWWYSKLTVSIQLTKQLQNVWWSIRTTNWKKLPSSRFYIDWFTIPFSSNECTDTPYFFLINLSRQSQTILVLASKYLIWLIWLITLVFHKIRKNYTDIIYLKYSFHHFLFPFFFYFFLPSSFSIFCLYSLISFVCCFILSLSSFFRKSYLISFFIASSGKKIFPKITWLIAFKPLYFVKAYI